MIRKEELSKLFPSKVDLEGDQLLTDTFTHFVRKGKAALSKKDSRLEKICTEEYDELSKQLEISTVQEGCSVRNVLFTRRLASTLIDDEGEFDMAALDQAIALIRKNCYSLGKNRQHDAKRYEYILTMLERIRDEKSLRQKIQKIDKPYSNKVADQIIRETLTLPEKTVVTETHTRRAVLSALLCYLRQSVGSCFATAPAIIVHNEQPEQFLNDVTELLNTGRLKRTFGGQEYAAPLSFSWGAGDLRRLVSLTKDLDEGTPIWHSPGLINALQAVEILSKETPLSKRREQTKELVKKAIKFGQIVGDRFYLSVEELLQLILLEHHKLTPEDIEEYLNRPREMIHSGLMVHVSKGKKGEGSVGQRSAQYLAETKIAGNAFKALADNALLKSWEFTVATFTETKGHFSKWNLYISLGLRPDDAGGIGPHILEIIKQKLNEENAKIEEFQIQYEQVYGQVKYLEGRMRRASEDEGRWLKAEYKSRVQEFRTLEEIRNKAHHRAESFANLFDVLIDKYLQLFPNYFQEVYDADMHHITTGPYDDSPAGFQLIYKYGRVATSAWTPVKNIGDFVEVLTSFFSSTEHEFITDPLFEGFQDDISRIITAIISYVKSEEFLETAFYRMAAAKGGSVPKNPLQHLDKVEKKPWAYTSGGSLDTLLSCYFRRNERPTHKDRWVENPTELLVFLIDSIKEMKYPISQKYIENPKRNMLMVSPTHAFNLKPGFRRFRDGWEHKGYTYIWCRDKLLAPMKTFIDRLSIDGRMVEFLLDRLVEKIPKAHHHFFRKAFSFPPKRMNTIDFRQYVLKTISYDNNLTVVEKYYLTPDTIDSFIYEMFPLIRSYQLQDRVADIFKAIYEVDDKLYKSLMKVFGDVQDLLQYQDVISANAVRTLCKFLVVAVLGRTSDQHDWHRLINTTMQKLGYGMPVPVIFADTNWVTEMFAFLVNPGTGECELWRVDDTGTVGTPMSIWRHWVDGSRRDPKWAIYPEPHEYKF